MENKKTQKVLSVLMIVMLIVILFSVGFITEPNKIIKKENELSKAAEMKIVSGMVVLNDILDIIAGEEREIVVSAKDGNFYLIRKKGDEWYYGDTTIKVTADSIDTSFNYYKISSLPANIKIVSEAPPYYCRECMVERFDKPITGMVTGMEGVSGMVSDNQGIQISYVASSGPVTGTYSSSQTSPISTGLEGATYYLKKTGSGDGANYLAKKDGQWYSVSNGQWKIYGSYSQSTFNIQEPPQEAVDSIPSLEEQAITPTQTQIQEGTEDNSKYTEFSQVPATTQTGSTVNVNGVDYIVSKTGTTLVFYESKDLLVGIDKQGNYYTRSRSDVEFKKVSPQQWDTYVQTQPSSDTRVLQASNGNSYRGGNLLHGYNNQNNRFYWDGKEVSMGTYNDNVKGDKSWKIVNTLNKDGEKDKYYRNGEPVTDYTTVENKQRVFYLNGVKYTNVDDYNKAVDDAGKGVKYNSDGSVKDYILNKQSVTYSEYSRESPPTAVVSKPKAELPPPQTEGVTGRDTINDVEYLFYEGENLGPANDPNAQKRYDEKVKNGHGVTTDGKRFFIEGKEVSPQEYNEKKEKIREELVAMKNFEDKHKGAVLQKGFTANGKNVYLWKGKYIDAAGNDVSEATKTETIGGKEFTIIYEFEKDKKNPTKIIKIGDDEVDVKINDNVLRALRSNVGKKDTIKVDEGNNIIVTKTSEDTKGKEGTEGYRKTITTTTLTYDSEGLSTSETSIETKDKDGNIIDLTGLTRTFEFDKDKGRDVSKDIVETTYERDDKGYIDKTKFRKLTIDAITGEPKKLEYSDGRDTKSELETLKSQYKSRQFFATLEFVFTEFRGLGYYATFFMSDKELDEWREAVDKFFAEAYLGIEYWVSGICAANIDRDQRGVAYVETRLGLAGVAAHIEATRSYPIISQNATEYLYKITFYVKNGDWEHDPKALEEMEFNIYLHGDRISKLLSQDKKLKKGDSYGIIRGNAIVQYSKYYYNKICIKFKEVPSFWTLDDKELCNTIQGPPAGAEKPYGEKVPEEEEEAKVEEGFLEI